MNVSNKLGIVQPEEEVIRLYYADILSAFCFTLQISILFSIETTKQNKEFFLYLFDQT